MTSITESDSSGIPRSAKLVVLLHGFGSSKKIGDLRRLAEDTFPSAIVYAPALPYRWAFSMTRAAEVVRRQIEEITKLCDVHPIESIILVGYSMGAVIARRLLIEATGLAPAPTLRDRLPLQPGVEIPLENVARPWAGKIERLVLIAGLSRGWSVDNAKSGLTQLGWALAGLVGHLLPGPKPAIFDIRRGAPFIVQTRIRWVEYRRQYDHVDVVQLIGTLDDMVSPADSVDYADVCEEAGKTTAEGPKKHFWLIEVPHTDHRRVVQLTSRGQRSKAVCAQRRDIIRSALLDRADDLSRMAIPRELLDDELPRPPDPTVEDLVFVIHGIRDRGYWTKKIAARIKKLGETARIKSRTPAYGYFPILPFLLPWYRRQKVEWLMDQYAEAKAEYPRADFHFMGHSNGTYLCSRALLDYPAACFRRIMFAGSVVHPDFPWQRLIEEEKRVEKVYNAVATADVTVALFPNGLRYFRGFFDLGGAGHRGFGTESPHVFQLDLDRGLKRKRKYVHGGHSAAKQESQWDEISDFIVNGTEPELANPDYRDNQPLWSRVLGCISPGIVLLILVLLVGVFVAVAAPLLEAFFAVPAASWVSEALPEMAEDSWSAWSRRESGIHVLALLLYMMVIRFAALRF